jgi:pimeloyl-ACP methyl ester carboxylesterase
MGSPAYEDRTWTSPDGLALHYRDYAGPPDKPPILCIPGLTRNARDFEPVTEAFAGKWRIICAELRGRGESEYARDPSTYALPNYVADIEALLKQAGIARFVAFGTSLGGIIVLLLALRNPERIAAAMLNDIGTNVEAAGLERIREYVGQGRNFPTWLHAARWMQDHNGAYYPDFDIEKWLQFSKRVMKVSSSGRIRFDYDMKIAEPMQTAEEGAPPPDLWPGWEALEGRPLLLLRGELSDILSEATARKMAGALPAAELVTVPRVGHAPTLDEPDSLEAMTHLLGSVE